MSRECSKALPRRLRDPAFLQRYFTGIGLDVGAGDDALGRHASLFPRCQRVDYWDRPQGDAGILFGVPEASYDFLHSSHCLEHLGDPVAALRRWCAVVKPGGHVIVMVPEWTMYEHEQWPSRYNSDHKHAFSPALNGIDRSVPYAPPVISLPLILVTLPASLERFTVLRETYLENGESADQTLGVGECAIEFVLRISATPRIHINLES